MNPFRSKKNFKEKIDSDSDWKAVWPRMSLKWHLFLRLSLGFVRTFLDFLGNIRVFTQKMSVHFCIFYLDKEELIQQECLKIYVKNDSTSNKTKKQKKQRKNTIQLHSFHF